MAEFGDGAAPEISVEEAIRLAASGALLIDVREQDEWDAGHAPTARLLPMSLLADRLEELPADERVLVICHSGGRSARVTDFLAQRGYDAINVAGGMTAWAAAGGPVTTT
jgi:rhodanese-related sulfurtransferase